jgi:hypothetical protein
VRLGWWRVGYGREVGGVSGGLFVVGWCWGGGLGWWWVLVRVGCGGEGLGGLCWGCGVGVVCGVGGGGGGGVWFGCGVGG